MDTIIPSQLSPRFFVGEYRRRPASNISCNPAQLVKWLIELPMASSVLFFFVTFFIKGSAAGEPLNTGFQIASGVQGIGLDLIAMIVSDAGLASASPEWWNASPLGCILLGLQPRGGWQIMQRATQWGKDIVSSAFGVHCSSVDIYAYFACSIRNRLEVWNSPNFRSPTEGQEVGQQWKQVGETKIHRPTKLMDGSRGGQAFLCSILRPVEEGQYTIAEQARMQLLSVIMAVAGYAPMHYKFQKIIEDDFGVSNRLNPIFHRLFYGVLLSSVLAVGFGASVFYALAQYNVYGAWLPYAIQISSIVTWETGAIGLFMIGGNPRVGIVRKKIPAHIASRLPPLPYTRVQEMKLEFGSFHGSIFTPDRGICFAPPTIVRDICQWDLEIDRPRTWYVWLGFFGSMLLCSIALRVAGLGAANIWSELLGLIVLLVTSIFRGFGISGSEAWMIPKRFRRPNSNYGAVLLGAFLSRQ